MVQPGGEKGYGELEKEMGVAHPEGNLGMIYSGHGLPRGDNENILPRRKWGYFIQGEKMGTVCILS